MDSYGQRNYGRKYSLDALPPQGVSEDVSQVMQHASASAEQPRLPIATGKELQVTVRDVDQEITERAGLQSLGTQIGIGRGGVNRVLRLTQGGRSARLPTGPEHLPSCRCCSLPDTKHPLTPHRRVR